MYDPLIVRQAREKAGLGPEWDVWLFESFPPGGPRRFMQLTGAIAPLFQSGPRKGQRNWRRMDPKSERAIVISVEEQAAYELAFESQSGNCAKCQGDGYELRSLAQSPPCSRCKGTGRAPSEHAEAAR